MAKHLASGGVIIKPGNGVLNVLLIRDRYGHWTWPKGHCEEGETPEETALREIEEETGLKSVKILTFLGEQKYSFSLNGEEILKTVHIFLLEFSGSEEIKIQTSEIEKGEWFPAEDALAKIEYEGSKELLEKGIRVYRGKM